MSNDRMRVRWVRPALGLLAAAATGGTIAAADTSTFEPIGVLPGAFGGSSPRGVSDDGSVVVGYSGTSFYYGGGHGYHWSHSSGIEDIDPLDAQSSANGISGDGSFVSGYRTTGSGHRHAFEWTAGQGVQSLYSAGAVYGVSRDGTSCVGYESENGNGSGLHHAIRWTDADRTQVIESAGVISSESLAVSADGSVVVGWASFSTGGVRAFRWTAADGMQNIGAPLNTPGTSIAQGVSGDGSIVVGVMTVGGTSHAFRWTAAAGMADLSTLGGQPYSRALGISSDGATIVGESGLSASSGKHAVVWRSSLAVQDLSIVLGGVLPAGWTLTEANAVTPDGTIIVGTGQNPAGVQESWIATFPPLVGDINGDCAVDLVDLAILLGNFGSAGNGAAGDLDGSGTVDLADLAQLLGVFGTSCP